MYVADGGEAFGQPEAPYRVHDVLLQSLFLRILRASKRRRTVDVRPLDCSWPWRVLMCSLMLSLPPHHLSSDEGPGRRLRLLGKNAEDVDGVEHALEAPQVGDPPRSAIWREIMKRVAARKDWDPKRS